MSKTNDFLFEHLRQYPNCTEETCPHVQNFVGAVIFNQPDNGFLCTAQAFNIEQAKEVIREGVAKSHPHLTIKKVEVKYGHL